MVSTVWSVSCLLFFYSRCPCAQPFVKVGARAPAPYGVDATPAASFSHYVLRWSRRRCVMLWRRCGGFLWQQREACEHCCSADASKATGALHHFAKTDLATTRVGLGRLIARSSCCVAFLRPTPTADVFSSHRDGEGNNERLKIQLLLPRATALLASFLSSRRSSLFDQL